jgi:hypothetical protein
LSPPTVRRRSHHLAAFHGGPIAYLGTLLAVLLVVAPAVRIPVSSAAAEVPATPQHHISDASVRPVRAVHRSLYPRAVNAILKLPETNWPHVIPNGFLGVGVEYPALSRYAGRNAGAADPVFEQLISSLSPGQAPQLRVGGDTSDSSWWPTAGLARPRGVGFVLTPNYIAVARSFAQAVGARLIMGVNLEADSVKVAVTESQQLLAGMGQSIEALELGNEPQLLSIFDGKSTRPVTARSSYNFPTFLRAYTKIADAMPRFPLAGPAFVGHKWSGEFRRFLSHEPLVSLATVHGYALHDCSVATSPLFPSVGHLLTARATYGLAQKLVPWIRIAHDDHLPIRVDETNATPCPEGARVLRTYAESLWALRVLFEMADVGANGVNIQTTAAATDDLFTPTSTGGVWRAAVQPEYYGLLMFAQAAPPGASLVRLSESSTASIQAWATRATDGTVRVVVMNLNGHRTTVAVTGNRLLGPGTLERLEGSSLATQYGVTLGGQSYGSDTTTGDLAGRQRTSTVRPNGRGYVLAMPAFSAVLLTLHVGTTFPRRPLENASLSAGSLRSAPARQTTPDLSRRAGR